MDSMRTECGTNDRTQMVWLMGWALREVAIDGAGMGRSEELRGKSLEKVKVVSKK